MAQFDVYPNPSVPQREAFPYFVVLQSDQLSHFSTRLAMPLSRVSMAPTVVPPRRLAQAVVVGGERLYPAPHLVAALPRAVLREPVQSLRTEAGVLVDALDAVVSGV